MLNQDAVPCLPCWYCNGVDGDGIAYDPYLHDGWFCEACEERRRFRYELDKPKGDEQPNPVQSGDQTAIWDLVIEDMKSRDNKGFKKYGTRLNPFNGRDGLRDVYEELLDAAVYIRSLMYEKDKK